MRFYLALWYAKLINFLIKIVDKTRGSSLSGEHAMKIDPLMVKHFKGIDCSKVIFITGTNGKSTSTNLITHIFRKNGKKVISNLEGANLIYGIAKASSMTGKINADYIIFETDERFLPKIYAQLPAENILVTNLQKDQVQRNGDPDFIYSKLSDCFDGKEIKMFLNNEEPRSRSLGKKASQVITYGVKKVDTASDVNEFIPTMACPFCRHGLEFEYYNNSSMGKFHCPNCGYESSAETDYLLEIDHDDNGGFTLCDTHFDSPYTLPFMYYNYAAAVAVAEQFGGISPADSAKAFSSFKNVGGRFEVLHYKGKTIQYMRIKQENPDTLQVGINTMAEDKGSKVVCLALGNVVDIIPHYTNTFYTYDCDFSKLVSSDVEKYFCFSDTVANDTALRLIYEGVPEDRISIADTSDVSTFFKEIEKAETDNIYLITCTAIFYALKAYAEKEAK